ncbi:MATE family efflux transporter [Pseudomonas fluorescens]|uniref:Uncharacterized protein n=1 Tax=Pseudomonas fluorescens TaxID=294 RepID=A0A423MAE0_PSEFL|nr:MATE family efflux transporter [Pseudomonas fluorescens]RON79781.1 hypothetical protein BK670_19990 [Pseudomonas fluorescens]
MHTVFSAQEFYGYALIIGIASSMQMIWSVSDLWVVGGKSTTYVAALGLVDVIFAIVTAFAYGIIDIHASQVSKAEGRNQFVQDYPGLMLSAVLAVLISWVPVQAGGLFFVDVLTALGQSAEVLALGESNYHARTDVYVLSILYVLIPLALRIRGYRKLSLILLFASFVIKLVLNANIYSVFGELADNYLEKAVVYTSAWAQLFTIVVGGACLVAMVVSNADRQFEFKVFRHSLIDMLIHTPKIAAWNVNDFVSSAVVTLVFGRLGVDYLAAANVAAKITGLFYRVPQALSESALVFYGYVLDKTVEDRKHTAGYSLLCSVAPVLPISIVLFLCADYIIDLLSPGLAGEVKSIADFLIKVHMVVALFYVLQHVCSQFLVGERQTGFLLVSSLISTWFLVVPGVMLIAHAGMAGEKIIIFERLSIVLLGMINMIFFARLLNSSRRFRISLT